jgi:hypothetical protein
MEKQSHPIRDKVIAGLIVAAIIGVLGYFVPSVGTALKWVANGLGLLWNHFTSTISVPWWLIYLVSLYLVLRLLRSIRRYVRALPPQATPDYANYTEDVFETVLWRWLWTSDYADVKQLAPFCPVCDMILVSKGGGFTYVMLYCEKCREDRLHFLEGDGRELERKVRRQIDHKLRSEEWKEIVARKSGP